VDGHEAGGGQRPGAAGCSAPTVSDARSSSPPCVVILVEAYQGDRGGGGQDRRFGVNDAPACLQKA
jgi:hypothetical protein